MKQIPLTRGKVAFVSDRDFGWLNRWKWHVLERRGLWYAGRSAWIAGKNTKLMMHRIILRARRGQCCDHRNHDGLDNRRRNLRFCTDSQNGANSRSFIGSSKYKGVHWAKDRQRWRASIVFHRRTMQLGSYETQAEAAAIYDRMAKKLFGRFAHVNFAA